MSPEEIEEVYFLLLVRLVGVFDATGAAKAWVARDSASRWWQVET